MGGYLFQLRARSRVSERTDQGSIQRGRHAQSAAEQRGFSGGGDHVRTGVHRIGRLLERHDKRGPRHAPHDRLDHPSQATRDIAAKRDGLKFDINSAIALLVARDAV